MRKLMAAMALALAASVGCSPATAHQPHKPLKAYTVTNPDGTHSDVCALDNGRDLSRIMGNSDEPVRHPAGDARCNDPANSD